MDASQRAELVKVLATDPDQGNVVVGSGGVRKIRFGGRGRGKRSGYRVMFAYLGEHTPVYILAALKKNIKADFTRSEITAMRQIVNEIGAESKARR